MRRFDKLKNIEKANMLAEQRYLETKGFVNESDGVEVGQKPQIIFPEWLEQKLEKVHTKPGQGSIFAKSITEKDRKLIDCCIYNQNNGLISTLVSSIYSFSLIKYNNNWWIHHPPI